MITMGTTPATNVRFRTGADVLPYPLRDDFEFPLPAEASGASASVMAPQAVKILSAATPRLYSDEEIAAFELGSTERLVVWGLVTYLDAFKIERHVRFAQTFAWMVNGTPMGFDTRRHNEAN